MAGGSGEVKFRKEIVSFLDGGRIQPLDPIERALFTQEFSLKWHISNHSLFRYGSKF